MAVKTKNRVLRRKSRKSSSPYRVHLTNVTNNDILIVNIFDEEDVKNPIFRFQFEKGALQGRNNIHFKASFDDDEWNITWTKKLNPTNLL